MADPDPDPRSFHSRYDPYREAERFVDGSLDGKEPSLAIVIGGGLNYIAGALRKRLPKARLVSLQPSLAFDGAEAFPSDYRWSPAGAPDLASFLSKAIETEYAAAGVAVLEWPPVAKAFPEACSELREAVKSALSMAGADMATVAYWSRRWLANSLRFASAVTRTAEIQAGTAPVVIACAGPSLAASAGELSELRGSYSLWALSSAAEALTSRGLVPDLIVASDPGFWSAYHMAAAAESGAPLALCPSAYSPAGILERSAVVPIDTGLEFERLCAEALGRAAAFASAAGSAAGTAISLALRSTSGPVHVVGLDLAAEGLDDHVRPYPFDVLEGLGASRVKPAFSARSARLYESFDAYERGWRVSRAFSAYAGSIGVDAADASRTFRHGDSPVPTSLSRAASLAGVSRKPGSRPVARIDAEPLPGPDARRRRFLDSLVSAVSGAAESATLAAAEGTPLPRRATIAYHALLGRDAAAAIARLARGQASFDEIAALSEAAALSVERMRST